MKANIAGAKTSSSLLYLLHGPVNTNHDPNSSVPDEMVIMQSPTTTYMQNNVMLSKSLSQHSSLSIQCTTTCKCLHSFPSVLAEVGNSKMSGWSFKNTTITTYLYLDQYQKL